MPIGPLDVVIASVRVCIPTLLCATNTQQRSAAGHAPRARSRTGDRERGTGVEEAV
jgi:hypothetical protein